MNRLGIGIACAAFALFGVRAALADEKPARDASPLTVKLRPSKPVFDSGSPVTFTIVVTNTSKSAVSLSYNTTQRYDLEIRKGKWKGGEFVWRWSKGRVFGMMMMSGALSPGKSLTFTETWKPEPAASAGEYSAVATFLGVRGAASSPQSFRMK